MFAAEVPTFLPSEPFDVRRAEQKFNSRIYIFQKTCSNLSHKQLIANIRLRRSATSFIRITKYSILGTMSIPTRRAISTENIVAQKIIVFSYASKYSKIDHRKGYTRIVTEEI